MEYNIVEGTPPEIHDRGRGPEIVGTRITVFDVMDYHPKYPAAWIADLFRLPVPHVELAISYVDEHRDELMPQYQQMLDFAARGNPPHIRAILDKSREKLLAFKRELEAKEAAARTSGAGTPR
jgi:hypothetical protein